MKYPIVIPSRGRCEEVITIDRMPHELYSRVRLYVPREEEVDYMMRYGDMVKIVAISDYSHRISEKRRLMVEHMKHYDDSPWFWMMDDDLTFFERYGDEDKRLWQLDNPQEFNEMFTYAQEMVEEEPDRFCAIGISLRQGNNTLEFPFVDNVRLIRCGLYNTDIFLGCEHNRIDFMGDFDVMLQMLRQGYDNRVLSCYAQDHRATNAVGGCETSRTEDVMVQVADRLAELHGDFVKTKWKKNKTGGLAERKDVTIYWKKARKAADL